MRSRTNTSLRLFVSLGTKLVASLSNATKRPSALIAGSMLNPFACVPSLCLLTSSVAPVWRLWTKISEVPLLSLTTRFGAYESKATKRPSALTDGLSLYETASRPRMDWSTRFGRLTRVVAPGAADVSGAAAKVTAANAATTSAASFLATVREAPSAGDVTAI